MSASTLRTALALRARLTVERFGVEMKKTPGTTARSERTMTWLMRVGVMTLAIGVAAFSFIYYQDQHIDSGPSMVERQIEGAEAAVKKAPNDIGTRLQLASAYQLQKRYDDELKQYDEILKADKTNRSALLGRGGALMVKGDLDGAASAYHKITASARTGEFAGADPQLQAARYSLGEIALKQGNTKEAVTELQGALRIDRTDSDALYLLGVAQLKSGEPQLAVDSLKRALLFVPTGWCEPYDELSLAHGKLGQVPQATYAGAMADFCHKKPVEAKRRLTTLTTGPMKLEALLGLALIAETGSNKPEAISWYQKALTVDAKNVSATSSLTRLGVAATPGPKSTPKALGSSTTQGPS